MEKYEKGLGYYVGYFGLDDIMNGTDKIETQKVKDATGLKYTNTRIVKRNGVEVALQVWVCRLEDWKI